MLLTRPPLHREVRGEKFDVGFVEIGFANFFYSHFLLRTSHFPTPLDLHVLGTPPAFVLSQDQTLMF